MFKPSSRIGFVLCSVLPWLAIFGFARQDDPTSWSIAQWTAWRDAQITRILRPTFAAGNEHLLTRTDVSARSAEAYRFLAPRLADPGFLADPQQAAALGNFANFVTAQHWMALKTETGAQTNALGMSISDAKYWEYAQPYTTLPELLRSKSVSAADQVHRGTYKYAVNMIDAQNATLPGRSETPGPAVPGSIRRLGGPNHLSRAFSWWCRIRHSPTDGNSIQWVFLCDRASRNGTGARH